MTTLLIDLDGTLVDPAAGIIAALRHALDAAGVPAPPEVGLGWIIGPPVRASLHRLLAGRADVDAALERYRAHYAEGGLFNARVYPGIVEALGQLKALSARLVLCTSKPEVFATRIANHFGLSPFFDALHGTDLEGKLDDKADLVAHIVARHRLDPDQCVMIGDRQFDMVAASRNGMRSIGVLWGYGDHSELERCNPTALCPRPSELVEVVVKTLDGLAGRADAPSGGSLRPG